MKFEQAAGDVTAAPGGPPPATAASTPHGQPAAGVDTRPPAQTANCTVDCKSDCFPKFVRAVALADPTQLLTVPWGAVLCCGWLEQHSGGHSKLTTRQLTFGQAVLKW